MQRQHRALGIRSARLGAIVLPEGEFVQFTLEVLLAAVLIDTLQAALEHAEEARVIG